MSKTKQVLSLLNDLKDLLLKEKEVLINNEGEKLPDIIQEKEKIMLQLSEFDDENVEVNQLSDVSREIKALQETNLTLTEQAMKFSETMLEHIKKAASQNKTYSKKGTYEASEKSTLLDQSL